jgi:hypothetical protein
VNEVSVRKLFLVIQNTYNAFVYDDMKVALWQDLLRDTSFERAQRNLRTYILNADNKFPPHPGILAESPAEGSDGRYIPNALETRKMLDALENIQKLAVPMPDHVRLEVKALGTRIQPTK